MPRLPRRLTASLRALQAGWTRLWQRPNPDALQSLAQECEHLRALIEGTNAGTWEWDVHSERLRVNARWLAMLGHTTATLEPSMGVLHTLLHPDDEAPLVAQMRELLAGRRENFELEMRLRHREGHWVWVQSRGRVGERNAEGRALWVSGIHLDVSAQHSLQERLTDKNRVLQSILDNIPVALSVFNERQELVVMNDKLAQLLDLPARLFAGPVTTFESIVRFNAERGEYGPGDVDDQVRAAMARALTQQPHQFERTRRNGHTFDVRGGPMPGGGFVSTYTDITERKRNEEQARATSRMLQSILDSASEVAIITTDHERIITLFNKGAERLLGYRAEEVLGRQGTGLFFDPDELRARAAALSAQCGRTVRPDAVVIDEAVLGRRMEWTHVRKDGSRLTGALVVTALTDANGERTGFLGVTHDISAEKQYQQSLLEAKLAAEQAVAAKGQFLANMSHEIRTPMNAILGMLTLLHNTDLDLRQLDYVTKTQGAAQSLLSLLNDILDFSKIDAGKMVLEVQPFSLEEVMRNLAVILSANIGKRAIEVLFDLDSRLPDTLLGDALRLQQVLINLGGNAIKFTERGEVVVRVQLLELRDGQAELRFAVSDTGIGIAPEHQAHIFSGFSQAEASTTRRFGGSGLGLSISQRLLALMGASLTLESTPGVGSSFAFVLRLPVAPAPPRPERMASLPSLNVLVVEDHPAARQVTVAQVESLGWRAQAVTDGHAALDALDELNKAALPPWDLIVMDWRMPRLDGWEATAQLRSRIPSGQQPLIVMVTAQPRELLAQRRPDEQALLDGFLVKPLTARVLHDAVREAMARRAEPHGTSERTRTRQQRLRGLRLLVVEDNPINQQVARELLQTEGALVELAHNGQQGVDILRQRAQDFDLVLMDIQMPVMDGYRASTLIRSELGLRSLPIVAMTANAMASDRAACLAAGMNDHVGKPIDLNHLVEVLLRHVRTPSDADAPPSEPPPSAPADEPGFPAAPLPAPWREALERLGGDRKLFAEVLRSYLADLQGLADRVERLLGRGEREAAIRELHTCKGLSYTVGATAMGSLVQAQLAQLRSPESVADLRHRDRWQRQLQEQAARSAQDLRDILALLPAASTPGGDTPVVPAPTPLARPQPMAWRVPLARLRDLLRAQDLQALTQHADLVQEHGEALPDELAQLEALISAFAFEQAANLCDTQLQHPAA